VRVFLSYRRGDVGGHAGRLHDALVRHLGSKNVFQDVDSIPLGQDFTQVINRQLDDCDAVLAVIGPGWLTASTDAGTRRLQQPDDYVRLELASALRRGIPVVPVLVGGAGLPPSDELPPELSELARRQSVTLRDESWHAEVNDLARSLRGEPAVPTRHRRRLIAGVAALAIAAAAGAGWWWTTGDGGGENAGAPLAQCGPTTGDGWTPIALNGESSREVQVSAKDLGDPNTKAGSVTFAIRSGSSRQRAANSWQVILDTSMTNDTPDNQGNGDWYYSQLVVGGMVFDKTCFSAEPDTVIPHTKGVAHVGFETTCEPIGYMELVAANSFLRLSFTEATEPGPC
jgi:hypothetical protein